MIAYSSGELSLIAAFCCAASYNGAFYNDRGVELGNYDRGYARISNTQVIQNNNINVNIQAPARTIETPQAAGKQPISSAVGKEGTFMLTGLIAAWLPMRQSSVSLVCSAVMC